MRPPEELFQRILRKYEAFCLTEHRSTLIGDYIARLDFEQKTQETERELKTLLHEYGQTCAYARIKQKSEIREIGYILEIELPPDDPNAREKEHELLALIRAADYHLQRIQTILSVEPLPTQQALRKIDRNPAPIYAVWEHIHKKLQATTDITVSLDRARSDADVMHDKFKDCCRAIKTMRTNYPSTTEYSNEGEHARTCINQAYVSCKALELFACDLEIRNVVASSQ